MRKIDDKEPIDDPFEYLDAIKELYNDMEDHEGVSFAAYVSAIRAAAAGEGLTLSAVAASEGKSLADWLKESVAGYVKQRKAAGR